MAAVRAPRELGPGRGTIHITGRVPLGLGTLGCTSAGRRRECFAVAFPVTARGPTISSELKVCIFLIQQM